MIDVAGDIQQILTNDNEFASPVVFAATDGILVNSVTCNAVVTSHNLYIDDRGVATVSSTARLMVSEGALTALLFPTRNVNNALSLKSNTVTFSDAGIQATFVIREAFGNNRTGLITCTLGTYGAATPPGRTIIGWIQSPVIANLTATPSGNTQTLANGDVIPTDYSINVNRTLTIPYMVGYAALTSFLINGRAVQDIVYTKAAGMFSNAAHGGFNNGNGVKFDAAIPIWKI